MYGNKERGFYDEEDEESVGRLGVADEEDEEGVVDDEEEGDNLM